MPELTQHERAIVDKVAASGRFLVQGTCHPGGASLKSFNEQGRPVGSPRIFEQLGALRDALATDGDERTLTVEVRRGENGYELRRTFDLPHISPAVAVLDPGYRYPGHPAPGMPRPHGIDVTAEPTDPAVLAEVSGLVAAFVALYTSIKGEAPDFGPPRTEEEIAAAEASMGLRLPEEVRALYRSISADNSEHGLLGAHSLLPLEAVVEWYHQGEPGTETGDDGLFPTYEVVLDTEPAGHVRRGSRSDWWVTVTTDRGCNYGAVDLDPAAGGRRGQLFEYGRDFHNPVGYIAASVTDVMRDVVAALRAGEYEKGHEESTYLVAEGNIGRSTEADHTRSVRAGERSTAEVVAGLDGVQQLYLNDADRIELAALAPLSTLRALSINRAGRVETPLPHRIPLESLSLHAGQADLGALACHPTLWHLELSGLSAPVDVAVLAALPALTALDLSGVDAVGLELLADLPGLRVLTLSPEQWRVLRASDRLPPRLAAARMGGRTLLDEAMEWRGWLMGEAAS
ncbi:SMI1/KNR4 family protein [Phytomonospora sp. NPDC050363]|uniref:SMI1/KNR4 family protein n=1 Tax=Phytomonospora sp. NPDC050363 TaxID=3155642 RepID=UPI0033D84982